MQNSATGAEVDASIPTARPIGAGSATNGQVLVQHDMLGLSLSGRAPKFVRNFMEGQSSIQGAFSAYVQAVKDGSFPAAEHGFSA